MYTDFMLDIETTGTDPSHTAILQIAVVAFNIETKEIDPIFFNRSLVIPPNRFWDESTRRWWAKRSQVLEDIRSRAEPVKQVLEDLQAFVVQRSTFSGTARLWGKPISFDGAFIESYFREYGIITPFSFREVMDMRTYLRARVGMNAVADYEASKPFDGVAHNALFDALHQTKLVLEA